MKKLIIIIAMFVAASPFMAMADSVKGEIKPAPWSGDWWSRKKGFLVHGWPGHSPSPFAKYDAYAKSRTGKNPDTCGWEADIRNGHYNPNAEAWEGHCNGWAAAAILAPEPTFTRYRNGIEFTVGDQKGILSEIYMNTYCNFYGNRNWGNAGDDYADIYPDEFHRLLINYIAGNKSAMICDIEAGRMVWNFPIYKFESNWSSGWFNDRKLKVTTTCYFVNDDVHPEYVGCKWFTLRYTYNLILDENNNIISGEWTGESVKNHPDFVWVPTADAPNQQGTTLENPRFDPRLVKEICEGPARQGSGRAVAPRNPDMLIMEAGLDPNDLF